MINLKSVVESAVTLSQGIKVIKDISNDTKEIYNKSKDLPVFSKSSKPQEISDFNEADKPLSFESVDNIKVQDDTKIKCINKELQEKAHNNIEQPDKNSEINKSYEGIKEGLKDEERTKIREESGWSDEIISSINSMEEYEIYKNAGLQEAEYDGKKCLIRSDIDWEQKDAMGRTNRERSEQGLSPINKEGKVIELHHIGQHADSPLAELTVQEHRGKGNDTILHNKNKESEIDRQEFARERSEHWEVRANERSN